MEKESHFRCGAALSLHQNHPCVPVVDSLVSTQTSTSLLFS